MIKKYSLLLFWILFFSTIYAQRITVGPGNIVNTNVAGPMATLNSKQYSSYAYIYPETALPGILHNDTIEAIDFQRNGPNGAIPGRCNLKIWMKNTTRNDFGAANINFTAERLNINAILVYDGDPSDIIDSVGGFKKFTLKTKFRYDTTLGKNLMIFTEYEQDSFPASQIFWNADFAVNGYVNNQVKFARDTGSVPTSSTSSTSWHPQIRLDIPRADYEGNILIPYTYGKIPVPLGNPDTIKLRVVNLGKKDASNVKIFVRSRGANVFVDSVFADLPRFEEVIVKFPTRDISNEGTDTLTFQLPPDSSLLNNTREHVRLATRDVYSYRIVSEPLAPGGIGFNGGTGNFVCKFASNDRKLINQVEVNFGQIGRPFRIGIWEYNSTTGRPGKLLWQSDSGTSSLISTIPVFPPVEVNGNFFAGVRQLGTQNVAFGYQLESPVRPQTFWYSSPLNDTNWIDFAPNAPFRFAIEPRVQANYDVMTLSIDSPKMNDTIDFYDFDTIRPTATFYNLGAQDMDTLIAFRCEMYIGNFKVLDITQWDSISSGQIKQITFDTAFVPEFAGDYRMLIYPIWDRDSLPLNDSLEINFVVAFFNDIGPEFIFSPSFENEVYEFRRDTVRPLFRIRNYAYNTARNFWTRVRILNSEDELLYHDSVFTSSLASGGNLILSTRPWSASFIDTLTCEFITDLRQERDKSFDTLRRNIIVRKTRDAQSLRVVDPAIDQAYSHLSNAPRPSAWVRNLGLITETNFKTYIEIKNPLGATIYSDTNTAIIQFGDSALIQFIDTLNLGARGIYRVKLVSRVEDDFETRNDTLSGIFYYGLERDAQADDIINPNNTLTYELNQGTFPTQAKVSNQGFDSIKNCAIKIEGVDAEGSLFYISSRFVTLDSSESTTLNFDNVTFSKSGNVELRLITLLANDQDPSNDTFIQKYFVQKSNDIGVDTILNPFDLQRIRANQTLSPQVQFTNYGLANQSTPFDLNCRIQNSSGSIIYDQTEKVTIDSGESKVHEFTTSFTPEDTGLYRIQSRAILPTDQFAPNDFTLQTFEVYYGSNSSIADSFPKANVRYVPHSPSLNRPPIINLSKVGIDNLPDTGKAYVIITGLNTGYSYSDSLSYTLSGNRDTTLQFNQNLDGNIKDTFTLTAWIVSQEDDIPSDNIFEIGYSIQFATSIKELDSKLEINPNPSTGIFNLILPESSLGSFMKLYDMNGKIIFNRKVQSKNEMIDISHLASGSYLLLLNRAQYTLIKK